MGKAWAVWLNAMFCFSHFFLRVSDSLLLVTVSFTASRSFMDMHFSLLVPEIWGDVLHQWSKELTTSPQPLLSVSLFTVFCFCHKLDFVCNCSINSFYQKLWTKLSRWFQLARERRGEGEKRGKMEIKLKCKSVKGTIPILSFFLIRSEGGKDYQKNR